MPNESAPTDAEIEAAHDWLANHPDRALVDAEAAALTTVTPAMDRVLGVALVLCRRDLTRAEHKYNVLKGKYNAESARLLARIRELEQR